MPLGVGADSRPIVWDTQETNSLLVSGGPGTGKGAVLRNPITEALRRGWQVVLLDPIKGGGDFKYAEPYCNVFAGTRVEAEAALKTLYAEVVRRKNLTSSYGVANFRDLPENVRPTHILLVVDEFNNAIEEDKVDTRPSTDPEVEAARLEVVAENAAANAIGKTVGRIVKEARSSGVSVLLAGQAIYAAQLAKAGASGLKAMMAAMLLGDPAYGAVQGALRSPDDAPDMGGVCPPGRGRYESTVASAVIIQNLFATIDEHSRLLSGLPEVEKWDLAPKTRKLPSGPAVEDIMLGGPQTPQTVEFSLDDLLALEGSGGSVVQPAVQPVPFEQQWQPTW
ncbi:MAG: type IV secretory system conjugative DNA transfer family protein [Propionibacteriaceae bacterium]|nr:type IV secretory system conjugative DNA transfer family protein [Propionibacteriaceae bacterium]